jgi:hypothetical protein
MSEEKKSFGAEFGKDFGKDWGINLGSGKSKSGGGLFYFLGFLGSAIYFISVATGFWEGVLGVLKSLVWPAFLVFEALAALGA